MHNHTNLKQGLCVPQYASVTDKTPKEEGTGPVPNIQENTDMIHDHSVFFIDLSEEPVFASFRLTKQMIFFHLSVG